jgi:hypothetical protein
LWQRVPDMDALAARLQRRSSSLMDLVRMYNVVKVLPVLVEKLQASALFLSLPVLILPSLPTLRSPRSASLVSVRCQAYDGKHAEVLHERFTRPLGVTVTEFSKYAAMVEEVRRCDVALPAPRASGVVHAVRAVLHRRARSSRTCRRRSRA